MGEFGFVTGDGVYHLTVYATDENGDFKILKMKNYYIGLRKFMQISELLFINDTNTQNFYYCLSEQLFQFFSVSPASDSLLSFASFTLIIQDLLYLSLIHI